MEIHCFTQRSPFETCFGCCLRTRNANGKLPLNCFSQDICVLDVFYELELVFFHRSLILSNSLDSVIPWHLTAYISKISNFNWCNIFMALWFYTNYVHIKSFTIIYSNYYYYYYFKLWLKLLLLFNVYWDGESVTLKNHSCDIWEQISWLPL